MSDLKNRLETSRRDVEVSVAEAETELARMRERVMKLEELIAVGRAMMAAGQVNFADLVTASTSTTTMTDRPDKNPGLTTKIQDLTGRSGR